MGNEEETIDYVKKVREIVRKKLEVMRGTLHGFDHIKRVYKIAVYLAEQEKADIEIVQLASLMHDLGWIEGEPHAKIGAETTDKILKEINYPKERRKIIVEIVRSHDFIGREKINTLEGEIVWDADKIDLIGMLGIVRLFYYYGSKRIIFSNAVERWFKVRKDTYKLLFTETAKELAKERYEKTLKFSSVLREEIYGG